MPNFNMNFDFIPVPKDFIENIMPEENGNYVKVYLTALAAAAENSEMTTAEIAEKLSLLESDVINALKHLDKQGAIEYDGENVNFTSKTSEKDESSHPVKKNIRQISKEMTENKALSDLCSIAQEILGKPLRNKEIETLYWFYDELGLSPEVIAMLLEYCVSKDKRNMNYIEKVAITWHENGIVTLDAVERLINSEKEKNGYFGSLKKLFGFENRNFSKTEETYLKTWRDEYGMDETMVGLAYEYCVMAINKISFPYMDSIIKRWKELGISTVEAAEKDHEDFKNKKTNKDLDVFNDKDTDYNEIEKMIQEKM